MRTRPFVVRPSTARCSSRTKRAPIYRRGETARRNERKEEKRGRKFSYIYVVAHHYLRVDLIAIERFSPPLPLAGDVTYEILFTVVCALTSRQNQYKKKRRKRSDTHCSARRRCLLILIRGDVTCNLTKGESNILKKKISLSVAWSVSARARCNHSSIATRPERIKVTKTT